MAAKNDAEISANIFQHEAADIAQTEYTDARAAYLANQNDKLLKLARDLTLENAESYNRGTRAYATANEWHANAVAAAEFGAETAEARAEADRVSQAAVAASSAAEALDDVAEATRGLLYFSFSNLE